MSETNGSIRQADGTFAKGNPGKPKGAATKTSTRVKEAIVGFLEDNVDQIQDSFDKLKPREKLQFIADILPYATPKLASIQSENETKLSGGINIRWQEPNVQHPDDKGGAGELQGIQAGLPDNS